MERRRAKEPQGRASTKVLQLISVSDEDVEPASEGHTLDARPTAGEDGTLRCAGPTTGNPRGASRFIDSKLEVGALNPYGARSAVGDSGVEPNAMRGRERDGDVA